jgi:hypothetical protein
MKFDGGWSPSQTCDPCRDICGSPLPNPIRVDREASPVVGDPVLTILVGFPEFAGDNSVLLSSKFGVRSRIRIIMEDAICPFH